MLLRRKVEVAGVARASEAALTVGTAETVEKAKEVKVVIARRLNNQIQKIMVVQLLLL